MRTNHPTTAPDHWETTRVHRTGVRDSKVLLTGREGALDNFGFGYSQAGGTDTKTYPRHHHNFEQVRHPLEGDYIIGKDDVLPAGWVGYFPEGAYYGPQVLSNNLKMVVLQMGGPSGAGFVSGAQRSRAFDQLLAKGGKFEKGAYTWTDPEGRRHNQDSSEAIYEQAVGHTITYPESRYRDLVIMNPAAFNWVKDKQASGVARKILGIFSEREIKIGFVHLDKGASFQFGTEPSSEVMFLKEGMLMRGNETFPRLTAFGSEAVEAPETLTAQEESELLYIKLATF